MLCYFSIVFSLAILSIGGFSFHLIINFIKIVEVRKPIYQHGQKSRRFILSIAEMQKTRSWEDLSISSRETIASARDSLSVAWKRQQRAGGQCEVVFGRKQRLMDCGSPKWRVSPRMGYKYSPDRLQQVSLLCPCMSKERQREQVRSKRSNRFLTNSYDVRAFTSQFPSPMKCGVFQKSFFVQAESLQSFTSERLFLFCVYNIRETGLYRLTPARSRLKFFFLSGSSPFSQPNGAH